MFSPVSEWLMRRVFPGAAEHANKWPDSVAGNRYPAAFGSVQGVRQQRANERDVNPGRYALPLAFSVIPKDPVANGPAGGDAVKQIGLIHDLFRYSLAHEHLARIKRKLDECLCSIDVGESVINPTLPAFLVDREGAPDAFGFATSLHEPVYAVAQSFTGDEAQ